MENHKVNGHGLNGLRSSAVSSVVALAISGSKKSKYVIRWAFDNLIPEEGHEKVCFKLLHVFPAISTVPTPMGGGIPISHVREDVAAAYRKEVKYQTTEKLLPYMMLCIRKKVQVELVQIESDDAVNAIADEIDKSNINKLVIGASSTGGMFSSSYWTYGGQNLSARISECCPGFCTIYVVSNAKLSSVRPSDPEAIPSTVEDSSDTSSISNYSSNHKFNSQPDLFQSVSMMNQNINRRSSLSDVRPFSYYIEEGDVGHVSGSSNSDMHDEKSKTSSFMSWTTDSTTTDPSSSLNNSTDFSSGSQVNFNSELEYLRMELRYVRGMYAKAQTESIDASRKLNDLQEKRLEEKIKLNERSIKEEEAKEIAEQEKARYEATEREAAYAKECAEKRSRVKSSCREESDVRF